MTTTLSATPGDDILLTDAGLETVLVFEHGIDLPSFAAFPLLDDAHGRALLTDYFTGFLDLAAARGTGFVFETPTWRANPAWGPTVGYDADALRRISHDAVAFALGLAQRHGVPTMVSGCIGPRGDGYVPGERMTADQAADYHRSQVGDLAGAGADLVTAFTLSYPDEAIGVVRAASAASVPVVVGFTVETDGRLPSGETLRDAVRAVDRATGSYASWFLVNCAHPDHVRPALGPDPEPGLWPGCYPGFQPAADQRGDWRLRVQALRPNGSRLSHAELDAAETLDAESPDDLARDASSLRGALPQVRVVGGCCGTDLKHVSALADAWLPAR